MTVTNDQGSVASPDATPSLRCRTGVVDNDWACEWNWASVPDVRDS